ncbi:MAG: hypothetical protein ABI462_03775 [Ignavibacteria bacterium]
MNEEVKTVFHFNHFVLNKNLGDITQEESLKCPETGGNCINWIAGHIIVTRDFLLEFLGQEKLCDAKIVELYVQGSEPIRSDNAIEMSKLIKIYNESQVKINKALEEKDYKEIPEMAKELAGFGFHEAYHVGQTGLLRSILGKPAVIK